MTTPAFSLESTGGTGAVVKSVLDRERDASSMVALTVPAPRAPLEALLAACPGEDAFLWDPPDGVSFAAAGVVEALEATGTRRMQHVKERSIALWSRLRVPDQRVTELRCVGGFSFQPGQ